MNSSAVPGLFMPAGCRSTAWFEDLFGFKESNSYSQNQAKFKLDGDVLVCPTSPYPPQHVGEFSTPSVAELRERVSARG